MSIFQIKYLGLETEYSQRKVRAYLEKLTPAAIMQTFTNRKLYTVMSIIMNFTDIYRAVIYSNRENGT